VDIDALGALRLPGADGVEHRVGDYWADTTIALIFLRHFG